MNISNQLETFEDNDDIAIIGMAGRFPGARTVDQFWQNLRDGVESITSFTDEQLVSRGIDPGQLSHPNYVKAGTILEDIELFDAPFFGLTPREAEIADPQHRLFLECVWEALENSGYNPETYGGQIGLFAGVAISSYLFSNLYPNQNFINSTDSFQVFIGNDKDHLPTYVSYKLNLRGPSINVQTTCSTSLVAVHLACQSLLSGESDIALAGGVSIQVPQGEGYFYQEGGILSPEGNCRAFDAKAQGTVFGNGLGVVVLKRLADAWEERDCIHGVIKGSAINNDGSLKVGYTAPSIPGQRNVILEAIALSGVEPETIDYIETHGTGTVLGDPIEITALTQAFRTSTEEKEFCAIGSVKTNVGHLNTAAGIAGLIKTVQALKHQEIPPSLNFKQANPQIDFANSPFYVNTNLSPWSNNGTPRRAGVSSFGIGGTNAHVILEEAPIVDPSSSSRPWQLLVLSAKSPTALEQATANLVAHIQENPDLQLADVAHTLQVGRQAFNYRRIALCENLEDSLKVLTNLDPQRVVTHHQKPANRSVVMMFSGQGSQYINMAQELYESEETFSRHVDHCAAILQPYLGLDLRHILYPKEEEKEAASQKLQQTAITQPALFVVEYSLAQLWMEWGVEPVAAIGHSIGEYVAATIAGVFSLPEALTLVAARGKLMQQCPPGSMLAVSLAEKEIEPLLGEKLSLAAVNSPSSCVISGTTQDIEVLQEKLLAQDVKCRLLHTSHGFHSQMMEPVLEPFALELDKVTLKTPQIPFMSNLTGTWIKPEEATDSHYWLQHLRQAVRFSSGISKLLQQESERIFLEVGPGRTLSSLTRKHLEVDSQQVVLSSLPHPQEQKLAQGFILNALGRLWLAGVKINWSGFYTHEQRDRLPLPTYPFERQRYWVDSVREQHQINSHKSKVKNQSLTNRCFVFVDETEASSQLIDKLAKKGVEAITLQKGEKFTKLSDSNYIINTQDSNDYEVLIEELFGSSQSLPQQNSSYSRPTLGNAYVAPTNELEKQVAAIWQEVLGIKQIGIYDNFFELGGDSLVATQLISRLRENFPVELPLRDLLVDASTVSKQAEGLENLLLEKIEELSEEEVEMLLQG